MPIYEYICLKCNAKFSVFQVSHSSVAGTICPKCDSGEIKKVMSSFSCASASESDASSPIPSPGFSGGG